MKNTCSVSYCGKRALATEKQGGEESSECFEILGEWKTGAMLAEEEPAVRVAQSTIQGLCLSNNKHPEGCLPWSRGFTSSDAWAKEGHGCLATNMENVLLHMLFTVPGKWERADIVSWRCLPKPPWTPAWSPVRGNRVALDPGWAQMLWIGEMVTRRYFRHG